jgi:hypothetical protein
MRMGNGVNAVLYTGISTFYRIAIIPYDVNIMWHYGDLRIWQSRPRLLAMAIP